MTNPAAPTADGCAMQPGADMTPTMSAPLIPELVPGRATSMCPPVNLAAGVV